MLSYRKEKKPGRKNIFIIAGLIIVSLIVTLAFYYSFRIDENRYDNLIAKAALKYNVDSRLIKAVISQESKFDPRARGSAGEIGLMQIMPKGSAADWTRYYKIDKVHEGLLFGPELNIEIGTWYLSMALRRWKNYKYAMELALCQYNAGGKRAESWKPNTYDGTVIDRIRIKSTRAYVESVMRKYNKYCDK